MEPMSVMHKSLLFMMLTFNILALFFAFRAKRMTAGYRAEFLNTVIGAFLIFSVATGFHFLREFALDMPDLVLLEHSLILLSIVCLLLTGLLAMRNRLEWGIP
jgi:lipopolysaccharide export LptBFGC system permease protein LptF